MHRQANLPAGLLDAAVELMGKSGRGGTVRVRGVSMVPTLKPDQVVQLEFAPGRLVWGDLLVFRGPDYLVVHRFLGRGRRRGRGPYLRARGDNLPHLDAPVPPDAVVGRVLAVEDGACWRSFRSRAARRYALAVAWHDLFWSIADVAARNADRLTRAVRIGAPFKRRVNRLDRWLLQRIHGLCFDRIHPPKSG